MTTEVGPSATTLIKVGPDQAMRLLSRLWVPGDEELVRRTIRGLVDLVESMERHGHDLALLNPPPPSDTKSDGGDVLPNTTNTNADPEQQNEVKK